MMGPIHITQVMTILKCKDELTLINPVRLDKDVEKDMLKLGKVAHCVRLCSAHGSYELYYFEKFKCKMWTCNPAEMGTPKGVWKGRVVVYEEMTDANRPAALKQAQIYTIPGNAKSREILLFFPERKFIVTSDFMQNYPTDEVRTYAAVLSGVAKLLFLLINELVKGYCKIPEWSEGAFQLKAANDVPVCQDGFSFHVGNSSYVIQLSCAQKNIQSWTDFLLLLLLFSNVPLQGSALVDQGTISSHW